MLSVTKSRAELRSFSWDVASQSIAEQTLCCTRKHGETIHVLLEAASSVYCPPFSALCRFWISLALAQPHGVNSFLGPRIVAEIGCQHLGRQESTHHKVRETALPVRERERERELLANSCDVRLLLRIRRSPPCNHCSFGCGDLM